MSTIVDQQREVRLEMEKDNTTDTNLISSENERELRDFLREEYKTHYLRVRLAPLLLERKEHPRTVDDLYVPVLKKLFSQEQCGREMQTQYVDILDEKLNDGNSNIYVVGDAGMGKTILCRKILSTWCTIDDDDFAEKTEEKNIEIGEYQDVTANTLKKFPYVFYISLRNIHRGQSVEEMIVNQLLEGNHKKTFYDVIEKYPGQCLYIIDGLDEWNSQPLAIPKREYKCLSLFTTRPSKLDIIRQESKGGVIEIELTGFDDKLAKLLIQKVIDKMNSNSHEKSVQQFYSECDVQAFGGNPMLLKFMTFVWHITGKGHTSRTELYLDIVEWNFKAVLSKHICGAFDAGPTVPMLPEILKTRQTLQKFQPFLTKLGHFCFTYLGRSLVFTKEKLRDFGMTSDEINMAHQLGVRSIASDDGRSTVKKDISISCIHKTFQELFAALYVAQYPKELQNLLGKREFSGLSFVLQFIEGFNSKLLTNVLNYTAGEQTRPLNVRPSTERTCERKRVLDEKQTLDTSIPAHDGNDGDIEISEQNRIDNLSIVEEKNISIVEGNQNLEQSSLKDSCVEHDIHDDVISIESKSDESDGFDKSSSLVSNYESMYQTDSGLVNNTPCVGDKGLNDSDDEPDVHEDVTSMETKSDRFNGSPSLDVSNYESVYQTDELLANNTQSVGAIGCLIDKCTESAASWPAYEFSCDHIKNLCFHYQEMLGQFDLSDVNLEHLCKTSLQDTVTVLAVAEASKCISKKLETTTEDEPFSDLKMEPIGSDVFDQRSLSGTTIIVAFISDMHHVARLCKRFSQGNQKPILALVESSSTSGYKFVSEFSRICVVSPENILEDIDNILESHAFEVVNSISKTFETFTITQDEFKGHVYANDTERLVGLSGYVNSLQAIGLEYNGDGLTGHIATVEANSRKMSEFQSKLKYMYVRSKIPEKEWPAFRDKMTVEINQGIIREVLSIANVTGCGVKFGTLHVFLDDKINYAATEEARENVTLTLQKLGVTHFVFHIRMDVKYFSSIRIGDNVRCGNGVSTLGCFARKTDTKCLYAMFSKHLLHADPKSTKVILGKDANDRDILGELLQPLIHLDLAAAQITGVDESNFETRIIGKSGRPVNRVVVFNFKKDINTLTELVYIWGAKSRPGIGEIDLEYFEKQKGTSDEDGMDNYIRIKGINGKAFCEEGDSGALVCAKDRNGRKVYAIAVVMGEDCSKKCHYFALGLQTALAEFKKCNGVQFILCNGD